jgi:hypothetical protein
MLLVVPLVAITGFPQWIPHFSALAFDDDDDDDDDLPWPFISFFFWDIPTSVCNPLGYIFNSTSA